MGYTIELLHKLENRVRVNELCLANRNAWLSDFLKDHAENPNH